VLESSSPPARSWKRRLRRGLGLLLLLGIIALGGWMAGREIWAGYQIEAAQKATSHQDYAEARRCLERALRVRPHSPALHLLAARAARQSGNLTDADRHLRECARLQGGVSEDLQLERLMFRAQTGEVEAVLENLYVYVRETRPEAPLVLEAICQGFIRERLIGPALACIDQWLALEPDNAQAHYCRAWCLSEQGGTEEAARSLQHAFEQSPERDDIRLALAGVLTQLHHYPEAAAHFEALLPRMPHDQMLLLGLAQCQVALGEPGRAQELLDTLIEESPRSTEALVERGKLALALDHPAEAEGWCRRALETDPNCYPAAYQLVLCLDRLGNKKESAELTKKLQRMEADMSRLQKLMTGALRSENQGPDLYHEVGALMLRTGREEDGLVWLGKALRLDPTHQPTHRELADYFDRHDDKERARRHREMLRSP
jgi:tetratricopeptide (TPR) repeat protein